MKFKLSFLFFFITIIQIINFQTYLFGQTTYYISSSQGKDSNNGTSPSSAWQTLTKLQSNLSSALPGDKFLLKREDTWTTRSGRTVTYGGAVGLDLSSCQGTSSNYITIGAYGSGSLPLFNFTGTGDAIWFEGSHYVRIENLKVESTSGTLNRPKRIFSSIGSIHGGTHNLIFSGCIFGNAVMGVQIQDGAPNHITIDNCTFENIHFLSGEDNQSEAVYITASNLVVTNCTFINTGAHNSGVAYGHHLYIEGCRDILIQNNQFLASPNNDGGIALANVKHADVIHNTFDTDIIGVLILGRGSLITQQDEDSITVAGNIFTNMEWSAIKIYHNSDSNNPAANVKNIWIYNNLFYDNEAIFGGVLIEDNSTTPAGWTLQNVYFYNNTFVNNGSGSATFNITHNSQFVYSNIKIKNNILYNDAYSGSVLMKIATTSILSNITLDNNLYYQTIGHDIKINETNKTLAQFQSEYTSEEQHSISGNPLFVNLNKDFHIQFNSPAKNTGINLFNIGVTTDFSGNARPTNINFDIGAFQYGTGTNRTSGLKIFLEGCYLNGMMTTNLDDQKTLPFSQPYVGTPWDYSGNEKVTSIPQNIVDWVLVELRKSTDFSSKVARQAAFINASGKIVDLSGVHDISFNNVSDGDYFVFIIQRNHLAVMSANPVTLTNGNISYDFTTDENKAYGTNALV